ncbi:MAG: polyvinylalcohol dehydrogenase [Pedosphaera sp.]|nr:polyvinylalcohol dehydrogenase [Pedosphaera sp.]
MKSIFRLAALPVACLALTASATDWPQWRGPDRNDISTETGLLKAWPAGGPPLAWKARGLGVGYSSVAVAGGKIFTMGDSPDAGTVKTLDAKDGSILWTTPIGKPGGNYPGTRCTPTVDGTLVYALGQFGDFVCLEAASGKEVWKKNFKNDFGGSGGGWNYTESPLVDGNKVIVTPGGKNGAIVALDKKTGDVLWRATEYTDRAEYSSLIAEVIGGVRQYIQLTGDSVAGVAAADGKLLWRAPRKGSTAIITTPVYHDGHVYVTSGYGVGCNLFKVTKAGAAFQAEQVYANKDMVNHHGGVIRLGENVYGHSDSKGWICQNFKTGATVWSSNKPGKGSITCADGHFYLRTEGGKGTVVLIEATPEAYKETGRFDQPNRSGQNSWAHPVVANGKLYLRDQDLLLCYDVKLK